MDDKKIINVGIWSILAIVAISAFMIFMINYTNGIGGAFSASQVYNQNIGPAQVCYENNCEYVGHIFPDPQFGPGRVDCVCNGEGKTFQLLESDLDMYYSYYQ